MNRIFVPSNGAADWQQFLAKPDLHWAVGYSARTMAHSWEAANGFPPEVSRILTQAFGPTELLLAFPEWKTPLPGGRRESQSDVFALGRHSAGTVACAIEGKVDEPFGPTVGQQMENATPGKVERLSYLSEMLGLDECPADVHYQLLHRTVSAVIEADRFGAADAAMIVHSFSPEGRWFEALSRFSGVLGVKLAPGEPVSFNTPSGRRLVLGWATGDQHFRAV